MKRINYLGKNDYTFFMGKNVLNLENYYRVYYV